MPQRESHSVFPTRLRHVLEFTLVCVLTTAASARAQTVLSVDPPVTLYEARPGDSITGSITILNPGDRRVRAVLNLGDWHYREDGTAEYPEAGTLERSLSSWVSFTPSDLMLDPRARGTVRYTVTVPPDAAPGSHWGVLFITGEDPEPPPGVTLATLSVRVAHVVYVNLPPEQPAGKITGIFGQLPEGSDDSYTLAIQYANTGNVAQRLQGYVELRDSTGKSLFKFDFPLRITLPGDTTVQLFHVLGPLEPGTYSALVVYNYGDPNVDVAGEYSFVLGRALVAPKAPAGEQQAGAGPSPGAP